MARKLTWGRALSVLFKVTFGPMASLILLAFFVWASWTTVPLKIDRFEVANQRILWFERTVFVTFSADWAIEITDPNGGKVCSASGSSVQTEFENPRKRIVIGNLPGCPEVVPVGSHVVITIDPRPRNMDPAHAVAVAA